MIISSKKVISLNNTKYIYNDNVDDILLKITDIYLMTI